MRDITGWSFADDMNKMHDFMTLSMEDFLNGYSYLDEDDYYATYNEVVGMIKRKYPYAEMED